MEQAGTIQLMCEEPKDGGTKATEEKTEKKGSNKICSKSQTLIFDSPSPTRTPTPTKNETQTSIEGLARVWFTDQVTTDLSFVHFLTFSHW